MSKHEEGVTITDAGAAYLKCHPTHDATNCGACGRTQAACFKTPCITRLSFCGDPSQ